jgi:hypothetical protein
LLLPLAENSSRAAGNGTTEVVEAIDGTVVDDHLPLSCWNGVVSSDDVSLLADGAIGANAPPSGRD